MSAQLNDLLCYACITHVPLLIRFPGYVRTIHLGKVEAPGLLNLRDLAPRWADYHKVVGGSAGIFALRNYILSYQTGAQQIGICQYRKFMTRYRIGVPATNYQVMDVISRNVISDDILTDSMLPKSRDFLIVMPGQFLQNGVNCNYLYQYKDVHYVEDLLRFAAMAVELGVLDKNDVIWFLQEKVFLAGGMESGIFPADFWLPTIGAIETVTWECVRRYDIRREGPQARIWAYCIERLGSYLLLKKLRTVYGHSAWIDICTGYLNLITDEGFTDYVPGI
jgi:hypothetical protein